VLVLDGGIVEIFGAEAQPQATTPAPRRARAAA
jgi:hypothetical protein